MHLLKLPIYLCSGIMGKSLVSDICGWLIILEVDSFNLRSERPPELWVCGCFAANAGDKRCWHWGPATASQ